MKHSCYDYAISYLSRYPKSAYELDKQLQKKNYDSQEREDTLIRLQHIGLLDDRVYAELYLRSEVERKGKSLFIVQQKLYHKGIDKDIVTELITEMEEDLQEGQKEKIQKEIAKLRNKGLDKHAIIKKLQGRGYAYKTIEEVLGERDR